MMDSWFSAYFSLFEICVKVNFFLFMFVFAICVCINFNYNAVMVGMIYLIPLVPFGLTQANALHFITVSFQNLFFGVIELVIFTITVKKSDTTFDEGHIKQLLGHVLPVTAALWGLSFVGRSATTPMTKLELIWIALVFLIGSLLRILAVRQIGLKAFKFDIVFRENQRLKTDQLYRWVRHPSYFAMMIVIFAYSMNTHNLIVSLLGLLSAWFGFFYRIIYEERALEVRFGEDFRRYKAKTGMWFPKSG